MNPRFPRPFEDELIWSAVARYSRRIGRKRGQLLSTSLLGREGRRLDPLLPSRLEVLARALPSELHLTAAKIRDNHTLYRIAIAGLSIEQIGRLGELMVTDMPFAKVDPLFRNRLGVHPNHRLKFCPKCREADLQRFGEAGWRAPHQIPGVACCHTHKSPLIETAVTASAVRLVPLDEIDLEGDPMPQDPYALQYAEQAYGLFSFDDALPPNDCIMMALALQETVSGDANSRIRPMTSITQMVTAGLPSVAPLMIPLFELPFGAVTPVQDVSRRWPINPPALAAATAVTGSTLSKILSLAATLRHDESPPFACTNPEADCRGQNTIWKIRLEWSHRPPRVEFCCPKCGHSYCRPLPLQRTGPGNLDFEWAPMGFPYGHHRTYARALARRKRRREEYLSLARQTPTALDAGQRARLHWLRGFLLAHDREWVARHPTNHGSWPFGRKSRRSHVFEWMTREREMIRLLNEKSPIFAHMRSGDQPRLTYGRIVEKLREFVPLTPTILREMPSLRRRIHRTAESRAAFKRRKYVNTSPEA